MMEQIVWTLLSTAATFIIVALLWRFVSRRHTVPCPVWLRWLVELDNPFTKTNRAAAIVEHLGLRTGMTVLDFGCGPGRVTIPVAKHLGNRGKVVAVDIQAGMLSRAEDALATGEAYVQDKAPEQTLLDHPGETALSQGCGCKGEGT